MDKYEYNIKAEQIVKLINKKDFATAAKIADGIDWKRVRNVNMLTNVGSVYAEVGRYDDAKEILLIAFERAPIGRRLAYKLTEVCIQAGEYEEAERYYDDFVGLAPRDTGRYELQYQMAKKKGEPIEKLIAILQEYKKYDFDDMWAYELARLYHKAGMGEACISACDEIILWFGEGEYVDKAMELKMLYMPLSPSQQEKYNKRYQPQMIYPPVQAVQTPVQAAEEEQIPDQPVSVSMDIYNTANIQAVLAESMKELMQEEPAQAVQSEEGGEEPQRIVQQVEERSAGTEEYPAAEQDRLEAAEQAYMQQSVAASAALENADMLGVTKDLRNIQKALSWNNMPYPGVHEEQEKLFRVVPDEKPESQAAESSVKIEKEEDREEKEVAEEAMTEKAEVPYGEESGLKSEIDKVMDEIAEKSTVSAGRLSDERRQCFAAFLHINGLEEKLAEIFAEAEKIGEERDTSLFGNILIIGDHKSGKTTLATELMKSLSRTANRKNRKIAKISGDRLNNKGMKETISRLAGADLLIERAGEMNRTTTQELLQAMAGHTGGMVVVLEDTKEGMAHLIAENPEVEVRFTHKLVLKEYEISEWVELAKNYAQELDYGIDEMATLALSAKIDALYAQKTVIDMDDVKAVIDAAIEHSEKKNIKKLFETVFSRKYKDSDLTMLRENDFV